MENSMDMARVRHVGGLAHIELTDGQAETFCRQFAGILAYFDNLRGLDTRGVEPMVNPVDRCNVLSPDRPGESLTPDAALANAPDRDGDFFKVPKVLGES